LNNPTNLWKWTFFIRTTIFRWIVTFLCRCNQKERYEIVGCW